MPLQAEIVDVFGATPLTGNPLCVVKGDAGLDTEKMQAITRWLGFSETTFLLPPVHAEADYRVRIFTLDRELPFAGHPTLGTAHVWLKGGGVPRRAGEVVQECGAGLVRLRQGEEGLAFAAPPLVRSGPVEPELRARMAAYLGIAPGAIVDAAHVDNGPGWVGVLLEDAEAVLSLRPPMQHAGRIELGVVGAHRPGADVDWEVRAFFSTGGGGVAEDPVTGSLNASLAQWLLGAGRARAPYMAAQGTVLGRKGRVRITADAGGQVWVGGSTVSVFAGALEAVPLGGN